MKIIDLSHIITPNMPVYPGTEQPQFIQANTIAQDGFAEKKITCYSHTGTHIDAPAHILEGQPHLDELLINSFLGHALCLPVNDPEIKIGHFQPYQEQLMQLDFVLLATGWSKYWGDEQYYKEYPVLTSAAAEFLCQFELQGIGFDTISADPEDSTDFPVHKALLKHMVVIENLANLDKVVDKKFLFSCLPLKIAEADGSPVRAIAIMDTDEVQT